MEYIYHVVMMVCSDKVAGLRSAQSCWRALTPCPGHLCSLRHIAATSPIARTQRAVSSGSLACNCRRCALCLRAPLCCCRRRCSGCCCARQKRQRWRRRRQQWYSARVCKRHTACRNAAAAWSATSSFCKQARNGCVSIQQPRRRACTQRNAAQEQFHGQCIARSTGWRQEHDRCKRRPAACHCCMGRRAWLSLGVCFTAQRYTITVMLRMTVGALSGCRHSSTCQELYAVGVACGVAHSSSITSKHLYCLCLSRAVTCAQKVFTSSMVYKHAPLWTMQRAAVARKPGVAEGVAHLELPK